VNPGVMTFGQGIAEFIARTAMKVNLDFGSSGSPHRIVKDVPNKLSISGHTCKERMGKGAKLGTVDSVQIGHPQIEQVLK
jgi:hypothetical protein